MKKFITILLAALMLVSAIGCSANNGGENVEVKIEGSLEEIMDKLYADISPDDLPAIETMTLTADDMGYYVGVEDLDFKEAAVSEALASAVAHSVVLIRMNEGADIEDAKARIEANANPRKWICVEAEKVIVDNIGDLVLLIMSNTQTADALHTAFKALAEN